MIPKIIHYAWFGRNEIPQDVKYCIESWYNFCPEYEIKLWTEDNYDVSKCKYMKDAYANKKWAFVSDYFRLDVLYQYGGIYLDTDVELLKSIDDLLNLPLFMGIENLKRSHFINIGLGLGSVPNHPLVKAMRDDYHTIDFVLPDGKLNLTPCPQIQTPLLKRYGLRLVDEKQKFEDFTVFPSDYFCPMDYDTGEIKITENTYSIHHYHTSWESEIRKDVIKQRWRLRKKYKSELIIKIMSHILIYKKHYKYRFLIEIGKDLLSKFL